MLQTTEKLETAIVADLDREIEFAAKTSIFYACVFQCIKTLMRSTSHRVFREGVLKYFKMHPTSAWFERPLLMAAALHRGVLAGPYSALAPYYATVGGKYTENNAPDLERAMHHCLGSDPQPFLQYLDSQRLQTNEVSRGIGWLLPLYFKWRANHSRIVLIELGCSAGLNTTADHYNWEMNGVSLYGDSVQPKISIRATDHLNNHLSLSPGELRDFSSNIVLRFGCDLNIPRLEDNDQRQMLRAMVWGDDTQRMERLEQAIHTHLALRSQHKIQLQTIDAIEGLRKIATELCLSGTLDPGTMICVYNMVVTCYFDNAQYAALRGAIHQAFSQSFAAHNCLWLEHEPLRPEESNLKTRLPPAQSYVRCHRLRGDELHTEYVGATEMHPKTYQHLDIMP